MGKLYHVNVKYPVYADSTDEAKGIVEADIAPELVYDITAALADEVPTSEVPTAGGTKQTPYAEQS